jgi:high-affinity iron transporter
VYDLTQYRWLTTRSQVGQFLGALFAWDPRPSIDQIVVWLLYLLPVGWLFRYGGNAEPAAKASATRQETVSAS